MGGLGGYFRAETVNSVYGNFVGTIFHFLNISCPVKTVKKKTSHKTMAWLADETIRM